MLATVTDPEIPVLTIADLGILRGVRVDPAGHVDVDITPTYSACPAMVEIAADVRTALSAAGWPDVTVHTVLAPAWTTDWMSQAGRERLREYGIAPPTPRPAGTDAGPVPVTIGRRPTPTGVGCPHCGSTQTREASRFGSTACKSMWVCGACQEPFDHFRPL